MTGAAVIVAFEIVDARECSGSAYCRWTDACGTLKSGQSLACAYLTFVHLRRPMLPVPPRTTKFMRGDKGSQKTTYQKAMKLVKILAGLVLASGMLVQVQAADTKADPTGTYVWTQPGRNGGADRTNTLTLKLDGDKLTGKVQSPARGGGDPTSTEIKDGKVDGSTISFTVTREFNGNSFSIKYSGKLADGVIKGKTESERNGETQSRDWEAKKQEDKK
jgi:hypothetical protein